MKAGVVKNQLLDALAEILDEPLRHEGFTRTTRSDTYSRRLNDAQQRIAFVMDLFPRYRPGAEAHIHPKLHLLMPAVSAAALRLVNGNEVLLARAPDIILNQPIEFTAPKDAHERWFAAGPEEFIAAVAAMKSFIWRWVLPLLSEASTPAQVVNLYETSDQRVWSQRHWYVFVAAACQLTGRVDLARDVVSRHLGAPGVRKLYASVFASLGLEGSPNRE